MFTGNEQQIIKDIDSMTIDEARKAIAKGQFGSIGRLDRAFATKYLSSKEAEERDKSEAESLSISRKALAISEDANRIAERALFNSKIANIWAAMATLVAAIAMYIAYVEYIKTP
jgi:hypothetical protein